MKKLKRWIKYQIDWNISKYFKKNDKLFRLIVFHRYPEYFKKELNYLKEKRNKNGTK